MCSELYLLVSGAFSLFPIWPGVFHFVAYTDFVSLIVSMVFFEQTVATFLDSFWY